MRTSIAKTPPRKSVSVTATGKRIPIRLGSVVVSHETIPRSQVRYEGFEAGGAPAAAASRAVAVTSGSPRLARRLAAQRLHELDDRGGLARLDVALVARHDRR